MDERDGVKAFKDGNSVARSQLIRMMEVSGEAHSTINDPLFGCMSDSQFARWHLTKPDELPSYHDDDVGW